MDIRVLAGCALVVLAHCALILPARKKWINVTKTTSAARSGATLASALWSLSQQ